MDRREEDSLEEEEEEEERGADRSARSARGRLKRSKFGERGCVCTRQPDVNGVESVAKVTLRCAREARKSLQRYRQGVGVLQSASTPSACSLCARNSPLLLFLSRWPRRRDRFSRWSGMKSSGKDRFDEWVDMFWDLFFRFFEIERILTLVDFEDWEVRCHRSISLVESKRRFSKFFEREREEG